MQTSNKYFNLTGSCRLLRLHYPSHYYAPEYTHVLTHMHIVDQSLRGETMAGRAKHAIEQAHACEAEGYYDVVY